MSAPTIVTTYTPRPNALSGATRDEQFMADLDGPARILAPSRGSTVLMALEALLNVLRFRGSRKAAKAGVRREGSRAEADEEMELALAVGDT